MAANSKALVTVFGGSGFVGTQLVQRLARQGYRIRVAVRRPDLAGHVRMFGAVGQIVPIQANIRDPESVAHAVAGAETVVNLSGILFEAGRQRFRAVHTMGARNVAVAAVKAGAERLVHVSALGADPESRSSYFTSKALGETEVLTTFPEPVVIRPSLIFGSDDGFFNLFGALARLFPVLPVIGGKTRFQPIYVGDVAEALAAAVAGKVKGGRTYELGGPDIETMRQLMGRVLSETERRNWLLPLPEGLARIEGALLGLLPNPVLTRDQVIQLQYDNLVSEEAKKQRRTLTAFGIAPAAMDAILPTYMWRFRRHGQFDRVAAE